MKAHNTLGFQLSSGESPSGCLVFTTQQWNQATKTLTANDNNFIDVIASHELGHAVQMAAAGGPIMPNRIKYYHHQNEVATWEEGIIGQGPHCKVGFVAGVPAVPGTPAVPAVHGTCLMYGAAVGSKIFCSTTGADLVLLESNKENDCTKAVRKVDLNEPFKPYR